MQICSNPSVSLRLTAPLGGEPGENEPPQEFSCGGDGLQGGFFDLCECTGIFGQGRLLFADDDGLMDGVLDGIFVHPLDAAAELGDAAPGLVDLFVGKRALHGEEDPYCGSG